MQSITIGRFADDPTAQGVIRPEDGSWQLVIDKDGYPHLYVQVNIENEDGTVSKGMFALEDFTHEKTTVRDLMNSTFGGVLPPEEEEEALNEYLKDREERQIPCPR